MTDEAQLPQDGNGADPFDTAASGLEEPKFPVIAAGRLVDMKIVSCKKEAKKDDATRFMLTIGLQTLNDEMDSENKLLRAGFKTYVRLAITPSPETDTSRGRTKQQIAEEAGVILRCCFGAKSDKTLSQWIANPSMVEGLNVPVKSGIQKATDQYPASNTWKFIPPDRN